MIEIVDEALVEKTVASIERAGPKRCGGLWTREIRKVRRQLDDLGRTPDQAEGDLGRFYAECWSRSPVMQARMPRPAMLGARPPKPRSDPWWKWEPVP